MSDDGKLRITRRRRLPHWQMAGCTYYVTFCLREGQLCDDERQLVLNHIVGGQGKYYDLYVAIIMPDHVHAMLQPRDGFNLSRIMKGIKGVSARLVNERRKTNGPLWQSESFDRIIRNEKELHEKANYMLENSSRSGLVKDPWDYPFWFCNKELI